MFGAAVVLIGIGVATAATIFGYVQARSFTRRKLQFVDAAQSSYAPVIAGVGAVVVGSIASILPFVTVGTALVFGLAVGAGVASGQSDIRHRRLNP
jgi:hypothetical protein